MLKIKKILNSLFYTGIIFNFGLRIIYNLSLDDASCSIFKIIIETLNVQQTINKPKRNGIDGVNKILVNLENAVLT